MRRLLTAMMLLAMALPCLAADKTIYVDAASPKVGGVEDGTSEDTAWDTIEEAIADFDGVAGDHTVYIKVGTYNTGSGAGTTLDNTHAWTSVLMEGYASAPGDGHSSLLAVRPVWTRQSISCTTLAAGSLTLRNLDVTSSAAGGAIFRWTGKPDVTNVDLTVQYATLTSIATSTGMWFQSDADADDTATRDITFDNCTLVGWASTNLPGFRLRGVDRMTITNCPATSAATNQSLQNFVIADHYLGRATVTDNTITKGYRMLKLQDTGGSETWGFDRLVFNNNTINGSAYGIVMDARLGGNSWSNSQLNPAWVEVVGNTISSTDFGIVVSTGYREITLAVPNIWYTGIVSGNSVTVTGANGHAILLGVNTIGMEASYNSLTTTYPFGLVLKSNCNAHHNRITGPDALYLCGGRGGRVVHNSVYGLTQGAGTYYACKYNVNRNIGSQSAAGTHVGGTGATAVGTAVSLAGAPDLTHVVVGDCFEAVGETTGIEGTAYFDIAAFDNVAKTITLVQTPTANFADKDWYIWTARPQDCVIAYNIIDQGTATGGGFYNGTMHHGCMLDYNAYVGAKGAVINAAECNTIAEVQAAWAAWSTSRTTNDANSVFLSASPYLSVDQTSNRFLYPGSIPSLKTTLLDNEVWIGGWQRTAGGMNRITWGD